MFALASICVCVCARACVRARACVFSTCMSMARNPPTKASPAPARLARSHRSCRESLWLCLCPCVCVTVSLCLPPSLFLPITVSIDHFVHLVHSPAISLPLSLSPSLSLYHFLLAPPLPHSPLVSTTLSTLSTLYAVTTPPVATSVSSAPCTYARAHARTCTHTKAIQQINLLH
jgi:hypothetical protein